jgi:hypothetical protein
MKRPREPPLTEPPTGLVFPWREAAQRAKDPTTFLMGLGETEFAVLLAELEARRLAAMATRAPGRPGWKGRLKRTLSQHSF